MDKYLHLSETYHFIRQLPATYYCCYFVSPLIFQDPLEFQAQELQKHFKMGDHVKVIGGRYEGDTGLIVRVEDNMVVLFADLTMHEVGMQLS